MWELAVICLVVILLVLILLIVACWVSVSNACQKNKRHIALLEARTETGLAALAVAQTVCCTKAFLTSVGGATVSRLSGLVKLITWDAHPMNELPDAGWTPVYSTVDGSLIGWTVPLTGTYSVAYNTLISTDVATSVIIVNGQVLSRSMAALSGTLTSPQLITYELQKSFLVNLQKNDILSIVIINLVGPGITPPLATGGPSRHLHSLTLDLRDAASQSTDQGLDAFSTPLVSSSFDVSTNAANANYDSVAKLASTSVSAASVNAQNVEQWLMSPCIQSAITNASVLASAATTVSDQLFAIDSLYSNLAICGLP